MEFKYYLDDVQYNEPDNFRDIVLGFQRDPVYHGVFFEASLQSVTFSGAAADFILEKEAALGIQAAVIFRAEIRCDEAGDFEELLTGKLNIGKFERSCGTECSVTVPIEQSNCTLLFRNRFDQKVDIDSLTSFDKVTGLEDYEALGLEVTMPSKALQVSAVGIVADAGDYVQWSQFIATGPVPAVQTIIRPSYENKTSESITTTQLIPTSVSADTTGLTDSVISPVVLIDEEIDCFDGNFTYTFRLKGRAVGITAGELLEALVIKGTLPEGPDFPLSPHENDFDTSALTILHQETLEENFTGDDVVEFDVTYTGSTPLESGQAMWVFLLVVQNGRAVDEGRYIVFDKETSVNIQGIRQCPESGASLYMINEALSRVVEAVTDGCLRVRSDYYGRIDSQPYASTTDGCGSLRAINSGLQLRNAVDAKLFVSPKDMFEGLNPIDNIGFGIESDPDRPPLEQLRVEPLNYWYREEEILQLPLVPDMTIKVLEGEHYANVHVGYKKWEVEQVNGLDEVNANREFRTALTSVKNTLSILSEFVAGSYAIELTRQQTYAATGAADTTYDNNTFIYCVERLMYGFELEQGNILNSSNVFSPTTLFNWKIRPMYNLMRWFKTIGAGYANVGDTEKKLFFTAGTANYRASGEQVYSLCKIENAAIAENADLGKDNFLTGDYVPLWRPKLVTISKYPMSVGEYKRIKASPYGYISAQCGTGEWLKGYIMSVQYSPTQGEADLNLKLKWR